VEAAGGKGVEVTWLSIEDPLERIEEAVRGAKLLAISFVNFLADTGRRFKRLVRSADVTAAFIS